MNNTKYAIPFLIAILGMPEMAFAQITGEEDFTDDALFIDC